MREFTRNIPQDMETLRGQRLSLFQRQFPKTVDNIVKTVDNRESMWINTPKWSLF